MTNIAILGFGVVGSGVAEVLTQNLALMEARIHRKLNLKYILDLKEFPGNPFENKIIHDFNKILNDPEITIVAEMMGGVHPAYDFSLACLKAGKSVVTSNKEVVAGYGVELLEVARENNVQYLFEASVGGGIPIVRPLADDLAANSIKSIDGILNGTTNYILTKMQLEGTDFPVVLAEAQKLGYAEANPNADINGIDASRKIAILSAIAFGKLIPTDKIHTEGISGITPLDFKIASALGCSVKLIAHAEVANGRILAMVSPRMVPDHNPLYSVNDVFNGILVDADMLGQTMFYGQGAGKLPTASAVVSDILEIAKSPTNNEAFPLFKPAEKDDIVPFETYSCKHVLVYRKKDEGKVSGILGNRVNFEDYVALITGNLSEKVMKQIIDTLGDTLVSYMRM